MTRDFRSEGKAIRVPFFHHVTQSDFLPDEIKGMGPHSAEVRKYGQETQGRNVSSSGAGGTASTTYDANGNKLRGGRIDAAKT